MSNREGQPELPADLMLTCIPGCGKTQIPLCAAGEMAVPLIQFDVGAMMSKRVGETKSDVRNSLHTLESVAPCVLKLDEIEKGFGSVGHDRDSGFGLCTFRTVLK